MTPRRLDADIVHARLRKIRELLRDLEALGTVDADRLRKDPALRLAVERVLTAVVDLAVSVNSHVAAAVLNEGPLAYAESFISMARIGAIDGDMADELALSAKLRNVLVHQYLDVDYEYVARGAERAPVLYRKYMTRLMQYVDSRQ